MAENPRPPRRRLLLLTQLSIAAAVGLVLIVAWLSSRTRDLAPSPEIPPPPPPSAPTSSAAPSEAPPLSRTEMILEARAIAAAYAAGEQRPLQGADPLAGRRFTARIPFGCDGPATASTGDQAYYEIDPEKRTVRLVARAVDWSSSPLAALGSRSGNFEAVEGFWLPRPWSYREACPPERETGPSAAATPATAQSLGVATFFETGSSRIQRRAGRRYEHVEKLDPNAPLPLARTFRLVLEGRLASLPEGRTVRCWSESNEHHPVCLYAAAIDRVAFEDEAHKVLAEWRAD